MKLYINILFLVFYANVVRSDEYLNKSLTVSGDACVYSKYVSPEFRKDQYDFLIKMFIKLKSESKGHFLISPFSMWMSLAAIAEGSVGTARQELFEFLKLPEDRCKRQQYYIWANNRESPGDDVTISRNRLFGIDENVVLNKHWEQIVRTNSLTQIVKLPLKNNPDVALDTMRYITSAQLPNINLNGNSVLLDSLEHKVSWSTVFLGSTIERVPFFDDFGEEISTVNMLKLKKRVKIAYIPELKYKVLELPIGEKSRYRLLVGITHGRRSDVKGLIDAFKDDIIIKIVEHLRFSRIPIDIGIPQYSATTEIDVRKISESFGVKTVWSDLSATRNISDPPAHPTGFVQRVSITIDRPNQSLVQETVNFVPALDDFEGEETGLAAEIGREFIVNKPFLLGLFDAETYACVFTSTFSKPGLHKD